MGFVAEAFERFLKQSYLDAVRSEWTDEVAAMAIDSQQRLGRYIERWRSSGASDEEIVDHLTDVFMHWPDKPLTAPWEESFGGVVREINLGIAAHQQVHPKQ